MIFFSFTTFDIISNCLHGDSSIYALGENHDSLRYIEMAETLLKGQWMGDYNHMTLIRLPVYSMMLAINSLAGWPLHLTQQVLHISSIMLLLYALKSVEIEGWRNLLICILCLFHPLPVMTVNYVATEALCIPPLLSSFFPLLSAYGEKGKEVQADMLSG